MYWVQSDGIPSQAFGYESDALLAALTWVSSDGRDRRVYEYRPEGTRLLWELEADTKVDEDDPDFPVIAHRKERDDA